MKQKNKIAYNNEIDLGDIILAMWEKKLFLLFFILIFTILSYVYGSFQPKVYQTTITLRPLPIAQFAKYRVIEDIIGANSFEKKINFNEIYSEDVIINLQSSDNLINFVQQSKNLDLFKTYLKSNNISAREYFLGKLKYYPDSNKKSVNKFTLTYSKPLDGEKFLIDYVIYSQQIINDSFKKMLVDIIKNNLQILESHLEIAKKNNIENPVAHSINELSNSSSRLFFEGYKVLGQKKIFLNDLLNEILESNFEYNLILDKPSASNLISKSKLLFSLTGFFIAVIFLTIVFMVKTTTIFRK